MGIEKKKQYFSFIPRLFPPPLNCSSRLSRTIFGEKTNAVQNLIFWSRIELFQTSSTRFLNYRVIDEKLRKIVWELKKRQYFSFIPRWFPPPLNCSSQLSTTIFGEKTNGSRNLIFWSRIEWFQTSSTRFLNYWVIDEKLRKIV